ncbi:MAG: ATP-binding cassette, subfamily multidrug efflux pump [Thermotogaceae bacterium]|nr:ATP-binding cassette, subfamily multidrug efflux pump [Thermotogaceae bacterium]
MLKLFKYLKPYLWQVILIVVLVAIQAILNLYLPDLMSDIVNKGVVRGNVSYIWRTGGKMLFVASFGIAAAILASFFSARTSMGFGKDLREKIFKKVENFSLHEIDKFSTASLITRTTNDVTQIQQAVFMIFRMVIMAPIMATGGIIMAISKDAKLTMILLVSVPTLLLGIILIARKALPMFKSLQKKIDRLNLVLRENLTGVRVIRAFGKEEYEKNRFNEANFDLTETALKVNRFVALVFPLMLVIINLTTIAIVWFGAKRIDNNALQIGDLMAVIQYVMQIMFSFLMMSIIFVLLPRASASAERINEVLTIEPEIKETDKPVIPEKKGVVEFKNVTFRYPGAKEPAVSNISFKALPGKTTAIIGNTGSGKTTILNLIMRFYDVESGEVLIDGVNVKDIPQKELRNRIGYAPQKAFLFSGTIKENISFGRDEITESDILKAAEIAQVMEFAQKMPEGLNSIVSQGGTNLSGGQKQRISIARAIAGRNEIYLFDDTFSALDFKTDAKVRKALREYTKDSTVIIVSQRVATIMNAEQIIVLKDGKVEGIGTHKELMQTCQVYREIVFSQLSEEEIA